MSGESLHVAGVVLITVPAIEFGGISLMRYVTARVPGYLDNPLRRALFTAGHAHAGVLVLLALVGLLYVDAAALSGPVKQLVRWSLVAPPILMPAGFFLSIISPRATKPSRLIVLVYVGAVALAVGTVVLGVGMVRAA